MKLFSTLRSLVPPSSRSFHQLYGEFTVARDDVVEKLRAIREEQMRQSEIIAEQQRHIKSLDDRLKLFSWQLYRNERESFDDARKRFFRTLPKAEGELRLQQLACARLLRDFDAFCKEAGLEYWMVSGTLLGAVRHGGFIPWDDDADLAMLRDDLDKLIELTEKSDRFQAAEVFDGYVFCRQVRFRYRDEKIPCFVDVFFFDAAMADKKEAFAAMQENRKQLVEDLEQDWSLSDWIGGAPLVDASTELGSKIGAHFDDAIARSYADGGYLTRDLEEAKSVIWGVDNLDSLSGRPVVFSYDDIYPLGTLSFEGMELPAPHDPAAVLSAIFGDYLSVPDDVGSRLTHVPVEVFEDEELLSAMRALVDG